MFTYRIPLGIVALSIAMHTGSTEAQTRFQASPDHAVAGLPGLRIVDIRDNARGTCYLVFLAEPAPNAAFDRVPLPNPAGARATRDQRLYELFGLLEQERGAVPGTVIPNPFKFQWQADKAEFDFTAAVISDAFERLEHRLTQIARATQAVAAVIPQACAASAQRQAP